MTGPRMPAPTAQGHRTLVYCDDYGQLWGWWCRDCPSNREPWTTKQYKAKQYAENHEPAGGKADDQAPAAESVPA